MYSDTVYLFGDEFATKGGMLQTNEELPNGNKVDQKKLAETVTLAAFVYLQEKGFIELNIVEGKVLFIKTKSVKAKKLKEAKESQGVLEDGILSYINGEVDVKKIIRDLLRSDSTNPWANMLYFTKKDLQQRGIIEKVEKGKVLFIKTYKNILKGEIPAEEKKQLEDVKNALENFKKNEELYNKTASAVKDGISSRVERDNDND
jgi:hypothetical protein